MASPRIVQAALGADPFCGAVYVFRSKRMDRVKLLWWDGTGICLMTKRLEGGQFRWPPIEDGMMRLSAGATGCAARRRLEWAQSSAAKSSVRVPRNDRCDMTTHARNRCCARSTESATLWLVLGKTHQTD